MVLVCHPAKAVACLAARAWSPVAPLATSTAESVQVKGILSAAKAARARPTIAAPYLFPDSLYQALSGDLCLSATRIPTLDAKPQDEARKSTQHRQSTVFA